MPVSADLENGFADDPAGVAETVRLAIETGLAGCSVEDFARADDPIYPAGLAAERVAAAAEAAHAGPVHLVLTARAENLLRGRNDLADTIARLQAYQEAGADVLYAPGLQTPRRHPLGRVVRRSTRERARPARTRRRSPSWRAWASGGSRSAGPSPSSPSVPSWRRRASCASTARTGSGRAPERVRRRRGRPSATEPVRRRARLLEALAGVVAAGGGAGRHRADRGAGGAPPARRRWRRSPAGSSTSAPVRSRTSPSTCSARTTRRRWSSASSIVSLVLGAVVGLRRRPLVVGGRRRLRRGRRRRRRSPRPGIPRRRSCAGTLACAPVPSSAPRRCSCCCASSPVAGSDPRRPPLPDPRVKQTDRRTFFVVAGGVGLAAAMGTLASRALRGPSRASSSRADGDAARAGSDRAPPGRPAVRRRRPHAVRHRQRRTSTASTPPSSCLRSTPPRGGCRSPGGSTGRVTFTYDELLAMDLVEEAVTLACVSNDVGGSLVGNAVWRGVPLTGLLDMAGVHPEASQILARSVDDFTVGLPTAAATDGRTALVALAMNGEPLPDRARLSGPPRGGRAVRLRVGHEVADRTWSSPGSRTPTASGWSGAGPATAPIKLQSRVDVPRSGVDVPARDGDGGRRGVGAGHRHQRRRGADRRRNRGCGPSSAGWRRSTRGCSGGSRSISRLVRTSCRCVPIDADGTVQTDATAPPEPNGASGYHYRGFSVL